MTQQQTERPYPLFDQPGLLYQEPCAAGEQAVRPPCQECALTMPSVRLPSIGAAALLFAVCIGAAAPARAKSDRVEVDLQYPVGSIVIVNSERKVYYVAAKGQAIRYPVAVGKQEELWMGRTFVSEKKVDPKWIPVDGADPVEGGEPGNPLGKRALYLDWSLLRIHGTPSRGSIGAAVSNGCIRMLNEDVMDLFERVHIGAPVFAIKSRAEAGQYMTAVVGPKDYANPAARRAAKDDSEDEPRTRRGNGPQSRSSNGWYWSQPYYGGGRRY